MPEKIAGGKPERLKLFDFRGVLMIVHFVSLVRLLWTGREKRS